MYYSTLTISEYNSVFIKAEFSDRAESNKFSEQVSEIIPNFSIIKRNPKNYHKFKNWDGKIRYFNQRSGLVYKGLYTQLLQFANINNIDVMDQVGGDFIDPDYKTFIDTLNINIFDNTSHSYKEISPDKFQRQAFEHVIQNNHCRVQMATGSGKTLFSYCLINYLSTKVDGKIVVVVPRQDLGNQLYNEYSHYSHFDKFDMGQVSNIHSKSKDLPNNKIIFITYQTLRNYEQDFFDDVDVLIVDEAHKSENRSLKQIIERCERVKYKVGMSGTFVDKDALTSDLCLQAMFGDVCKIIDQRELIDSGRASDFEARVFVVKHREKDVELYKLLSNAKNNEYTVEYKKNKLERDREIDAVKKRLDLMRLGTDHGEIDKLSKRLDFLNNTAIQTVNKKWGYVDEVDFLKNCQARNNFIMDMAINNTHGNSLVVFNHIETHGDVLHELAQKKNEAHNSKLFYIHGKTKLKPDVAKSLIETSKERVLVMANLAMVKEGWSVNNLHFCYLAISVKSPKALIQLAGRLLRKDGTDTKTALYIFIDDLRHNDKVNFSYEHGITNIKTLMNENHVVRKQTILLDDYFKKTL